ncbi:MAG: FAD-dependent oxidoreductase [Pseudomonadota bacterium]
MPFEADALETDSDTVVIVGAGQAGAWVAITLRALDPHRRILLIGDEAHPPYERPPLSKAVLAGKAEIESAYIKPRDFYAAARIELILGQHVERVERARCQVEISDGSRLGYGVLVLATGAKARKLSVPGGDLPQLHVLRGAADVERIRPELVAGKRVLAIGAGFIGLEFAAVAVGLGCRVTVIDAASHAMGRVVDSEVARSLTANHERRGVVFRFSTGVSAIREAGTQIEIEIDSGETLSADLVVVGVGAIPNTDLAREAGLECDGGVIVDAFGRTSDPRIFAVGDVSRHFNPLLGRALRLESWQNAQNQGIAIGKIIAGSREPYAEIPWFWTDQYESNFQIVGAPAAWDRIVWRGDPDGRAFTAVYLHGDRVVAGNTMNNARDIRFLKQLILSGKPVEPATLADSAISLAQLAKG